MLFRMTRVWLIGLVGLALLAPQAKAEKIYEHHFDDLNDIVVDTSAGGSVEISTEQSVASGNALKMIDSGAGGAPMAFLTPSGLDDTTITAIIRYYSVGDDNDHASFRARGDGTNERITIDRGWPTAGMLGYFDTSGYQAGPEYPIGQWVTIGLAMDSDTETYDLYFAVGTEVTTADLVAEDVGMRADKTGAIDSFQMWPGWGPATQPIYIDELEIYSELGEGVVPEPSSTLLLVIGSLCGLGWYARRRG